VIQALNGKRFDRVLLLDILEHLRRPEDLLAECQEVLDRDGQLIVSLPNVANITVRLMLLFGRFSYTERGLLDRTHLRFFTRKTARRLLERSGYKIIRQEATVMPIELVLNLSPQNLALRFCNRVLALMTRLMPGLLGYQTILVARR
jgi:O-antigen biosynthesis protein